MKIHIEKIDNGITISYKPEKWLCCGEEVKPDEQFDMIHESCKKEK